ncbi:unnamed protein product [Lupinus luteus]|uniref:Protein NRT1/ PTR FAMILY 1.2-like n=1 Tax=Lupinus luteus TaxID=3873 RepID=A0AAV1YBU1_LUPLU
MEISMEQKKATQEVTRKKGGLRTMPFIIANETFEKVANIGLHINMILYLLNEYHLEPSTAAIVIFLWNAFSNFMPIFGAFISDSCLGRFRVIAWGTVIELLGLIVLWLTSIIRSARPPRCKMYEEPCASPTGSQMLFLFSSLALMALGAGGIRPCSLAFGADQINNPQNPQNEKIMKSFFNWYYVSVGLSIMISGLFIVYIQIKLGWVVGFGIPVGLMSFSTIMFFFGSFMYVKVKPNKSLLIGIAQVIVAAWRNRHLDMPPNNSDSWYFHNGSNLVQPTQKARILVPSLSKCTKKGGLTLKQRMGIGLVISCFASLVAVFVERKRRNLAIREGFINNPKGVVNMSAMWLAPQYCLLGLAEGFNAIGQIEFYYSQFPKTMSSIAVGLFSLGSGMGNLLASLIVKIIKDTTKRGSGSVNWLSSNLNQGHYDYYYAILFILGVVNLVYFFICSWAYGSIEDIKTWDEEVDTKLEPQKEMKQNEEAKNP